MVTESIPSEGRLYRHSWHELEFAVICTLLFGGAGIFSVVVSLVNPDGCSNPVLEAVVFGFCWSCFVVPCAYLTLATWRHILFVCPEFVRESGIL